ncbi:Zinc finger C2H2 protein [Cucumispora dikerogammari]|nr:Zinc finger C2H2 protein [Cucumispora dikerogammari]
MSDEKYTEDEKENKKPPIKTPDKVNSIYNASNTELVHVVDGFNAVDQKESENDQEKNHSYSKETTPVLKEGAQMFDYLVYAAEIDLQNRRMSKEKTKREHKKKHIQQKIKSNVVSKKRSSKKAGSKETKPDTPDANMTTHALKFLKKVEDMEFPVNVINGLKCHVCTFPECKKHFPGSSRVKRHYRTHFKIHPYTCLSCGKTFGRKDNMMQHYGRCTGRQFDK